MNRNQIYHRKKILFCMAVILFLFAALSVRLVYLMVFQSDYYTEAAQKLHERERYIKAARGEIYDRNGTVLATNRTVCTVSVIYNQIEDREAVISMLTKELSLDEGEVRKKVEKYTSREVIQSNVDKETGDRIRAYGLNGVKVDEDYKRYYPYNSLASKVIGFTGADNQGIIGLEVKYESILKGTDGLILTVTDARGVELNGEAEGRVEPVAGKNLYLSLDLNIQKYAEQAAKQVMEEKNAKGVSIIVMNPKNGEVYAMVNLPEFNLNEPFTLNYDVTGEISSGKKQEFLNRMWRNTCINDTYEPGSTFKVITATIGLETGAVNLSDQFYCPGYKIVADRRIRCHKAGGHGAEDFVHGVMNSCNPVFMEVGLRIGPERFCQYFSKLGLSGKTGIDVPGEASAIMHKAEDMKDVEMATVSFGQSFQITPLQLITTVSAIVNGGVRVTPHFGVRVQNEDSTQVEVLDYGQGEQVISQETSETMRYILEKVVSEGTGKRAYLEGYQIGGKTATSEKLPRRSGKYISSFIGFAPAQDPQVVALITIDEPEGIYYGGTVAAPVIADIFKNILPYLGIEPEG